MSPALIRDHELRSLIERLDAATEVLELIGFPSPDADCLGISLHECFAVRDTLRRTADFLAELRFCGGQP